MQCTQFLDFCSIMLFSRSTNDIEIQKKYGMQHEKKKLQESNCDMEYLTKIKQLVKCSGVNTILLRRLWKNKDFPKKSNG